MILLGRGPPRPLSHPDQVRPRPCQRQDRARGQVVEQHRIRLPQRLHRLDGQKLRVARSGRDERDEAGHSGARDQVEISAGR